MKGEKQNMNKFFTKLAKIFLGLSMAAGVGVAVSAGRKDASPAQAATQDGSVTASGGALSGWSGTVGSKYADGSVKFGTQGNNLAKTDIFEGTVSSNMTQLVVTFEYKINGSGSMTNNAMSVTPYVNSNYGTATAVSGFSSTSKTTKSITVSSGLAGCTGFKITYSTKQNGNLGLYSLSWVATYTEAKTLSSITVSGYTTDFTVGDTFSFGGTVTAHYSDSTTANVTSSATFSGYNMASAGNQTVTARYTEGGVTKTATYGITVEAVKSLSSITLTGSYPTSFYTGDAFSHTGMTVTANFSDSSSDNVTNNATFTGYNMASSGNQTVTVSYTYKGTTKTATYGITVTARALTGITLTGQTTSYTVGDTFSFTGTCTASYSNADSRIVTPTSVSSPNMSTAGQKTITVSYTENGTTKDAEYDIIVAKAGGEEVYYSLTPVVGTSSAYASAEDIVCTDDDITITWNVMGNSTYAPWRIGGNSISNVDRPIYSKTAMGAAISKIEVDIGAADSITVNSFTLIVSSSSSFSPATDTVSVSFAASTVHTFEPTSGTAWAANSYYKFVLNVTKSGSGNKFVLFNGADFYSSKQYSATIGGPNSVNSGSQWSSTGITDEESDPVLGATYSFTPGSGVTITDSNASAGTFIATIASGSGTVTVSATAGSAYNISNKTVTIMANTPYINPDKSSTTGYTGTTETIEFDYGNLTGALGVSTQNNKVTASIQNNNGSGHAEVLITFVTAGSSEVYLKNGDATAATISVTINNSTVTITGLPETSSAMVGGATVDLGALITVTATGTYTNAVTWSSSKPAVASVTPAGVVTGLKKGETTITVTSTSYPSATMSCTFTVSETESFELVKSVNDLSVGSKYLIGNVDGTAFMSTTQNGNNRGKQNPAVAQSNGVVAYTSGFEVLTLGGSTGAWTFLTSNRDNNADGAIGYLYAASSGSNYLRTQEENDSNGLWAISIASDGEATMIAQGEYTRNYIRYNGSNNPPIFSCYASGSTTGSAAALWKYIDTEESVAISKNSISGLKTDTDQTVEITAHNFTPTDIQVTYSTSGVATVTKGTISNDKIPLTVAFDDVGTTTATIVVDGGEDDYEVTLDISVAAKPVSITVSGNGISAGVLEMQNGTSKTFSKTHVYVEDTDGEEYPISAISDIEITSSDTSVVSLSGNGTLNADSVGTSTVTFTLKSLTSVHTSITVNVLNDSLESVNTVTFNSGLTAEQGESPTLAVFDDRIGNTHFGSTDDIPLEYFRFSYTDELGVVANQFSYDYSHGTDYDTTHKDQTIYVYCTLGNVKVGSYSVRVLQVDDPLSAITFTNVTNNEKDISRGSAFQLEWAYTTESGGSNPTDGKEVQFVISDNDDGIDITVSATGYITIGASSDLGTALVEIRSTHDSSIKDYVYVSAVLESMSYVVDEPYSWNATAVSDLSSGDIVVIVGNNGNNYALSNNNGTQKAPDAVGVTVANNKLSATPADSIQWVVTKTGDNLQFNLVETTNYLYATNTNNGVRVGSSENNVFSIEDDYLYNNATGRYIGIYNSADWRCYTSINDNIKNQTFTFFKKTGGDTNYDVTETLFNGIHNNFGAGKTYEWDASCTNFDEDAWLGACDALMGISGYANYKLDRAKGNMSGNEVEVFLAKYDIIIGKVGTDHDWLGRFAQGGINYGARTTVSPLVNIIGENTNTVAIIVIISMVSVTAIGGYFFLRKRKENN